jgi:hypothetical protein
MVKLNKIESLTNKKGKSKTVYDSINNFSINLEYGKYLTKGNYHSYTFKITRFVENNLLENLVISLKPDGTYKTTIVSYNFTPEERVKFENGEFVDIVNKTAITVLDNYNHSSIFNRQTEIIIASDGTCWTPKYGASQGTGWETIVSYTEVDCSDASGSGGSGPSGGYTYTVPDWGSTTTGNATTGTEVITSPTGGGGNSTPKDNQKFVNSLNIDQYDNFSLLSVGSQNSIFNFLFANNYNTASTAKVKSVLNNLNFFWIGEQPAGTDVAIFNYLSQNGFSSESGSFVNLVVNQMAQSPNLIFDINASFKSPFNIDRSSIPYDLTKPENQKFNEVYDVLTNSPEFKKLFIDVFKDGSRFNVKFQIGSIASGANGNTDTNLLNPTLNLITISPQFLLTHNKMEIAKTIMHECIHAFLNVKLCDPSIGMNIPSINNIEVYDCVNQYYNGFNSSQNQHDFIYNFMLPTMQTILSEVKDTLVTPANNLTMLNDISVHIPLSTSPSSPFIWNDYYHNLVLSGLQNCAFFKNEIGTITIINGVPTVTNTVNQTLMQSYNEYNRLGQQNIHP